TVATTGGAAMRYMIWGATVSLSLLQLCPLANADHHPLCKQPAVGLRIAQPNTHGNSIMFTTRSQSYPVDVYSAFATPRNAPTSNYCMRYEALNIGSSSIERFFWPLARMQMDVLEPNARPSLAFTLPPGREPIIEETWLY